MDAKTLTDSAGRSGTPADDGGGATDSKASADAGDGDAIDAAKSGGTFLKLGLAAAVGG